MNILIDAGSKEIFKVLKEQEVNHLNILLTHGHADHIKYLQEILE
jgi:beta-lactamase superfamily II metal-dependent hydrolase